MRADPRLGCGLLLGLAGCTPTFSIAVAEFDSVAGWRPGRGEPESVMYSSEAEQLPAVARFLHKSGLDLGLVEMVGVEFTSTTLTNPAGYARQRLAWMAEAAVGDATRASIVVARLGWVLDGDPQPLNQMVALGGLVELAVAMGIDPLASDALPPRVGTDEQLAQRWHPPMAVLQGAAQDIAADVRATPERDAEACGAIAALAVESPPTPRDRRAHLLLTGYLARRGTSPAIRAAAAEQLPAVLARAIADSMQRAIFEPRAGGVRAFAARACFRLGGTDAAARVLRLSSAPSDSRAGSGHRYDPDAEVRAMLVRLCAQSTTETARSGHAGGPPVVEFLYDMLADAGNARGLRAAALEALAVVLQRPTDPDRAWADHWYAAFVTQGGRR